MSTLTINNLAHSRTLDQRARTALRGGMGIGSPDINVYVPVNISQANNLLQNTSVLNNSIVGPGAYLPGLSISPMQMAMNSLSLPALPMHPG